MRKGAYGILRVWRVEHMTFKKRCTKLVVFLPDGTRQQEDGVADSKLLVAQVISLMKN